MNKTLLQALYDGEVFPAENIKPKDPKYTEVNRLISAEKAYFMQMLSADDSKRFKAFNDLCDEITAMYSLEHYTYGFSLGISLIIEALTERESLARKDA